MNCEIRLTPYFFKELKRLAKRYRSLFDDVEQLKMSLTKDPMQGVDLGQGLRKIRMAITSKGKGKRGGARIITFTTILSVENADIVLVAIYDKSERENISDQELLQLKQANGL